MTLVSTHLPAVKVDLNTLTSLPTNSSHTMPLPAPLVVPPSPPTAVFVVSQAHGPTASADRTHHVNTPSSMLPSITVTVSTPAPSLSSSSSSMLSSSLSTFAVSSPPCRSGRPFWFGTEDAEHAKTVIEMFNAHFTLNTHPSRNSRAPAQFVGRIKRSQLKSSASCSSATPPPHGEEASADEQSQILQTLDEVCIYQRDDVPIGSLMTPLRCIPFVTEWDIDDGVPLKYTELSKQQYHHDWKARLRHDDESSSWLYCLPVFNTTSEFDFSSSRIQHEVGYSGSDAYCIYHSMESLAKQFPATLATEAADADGMTVDITTTSTSPPRQFDLDAPDIDDDNDSSDFEVQCEINYDVDDDLTSSHMFSFSTSPAPFSPPASASASASIPNNNNNNNNAHINTNNNNKSMKSSNFTISILSPSGSLSSAPFSVSFELKPTPTPSVNTHLTDDNSNSNSHTNNNNNRPTKVGTPMPSPGSMNTTTTSLGTFSFNNGESWNVLCGGFEFSKEYDVEDFDSLPVEPEDVEEEEEEASESDNESVQSDNESDQENNNNDDDANEEDGNDSDSNFHSNSHLSLESLSLASVEESAVEDKARNESPVVLLKPLTTKVTPLVVVPSLNCRALCNAGPQHQHTASLITLL